MAKVIITAEVQDAAKWEAAFKTHGDVFKTYGLSAPVAYTVKGNEIVACMESANGDALLQAIGSPATAAAVAADGVKKETVKIHVLDKSLSV